MQITSILKVVKNSNLQPKCAKARAKNLILPAPGNQKIVLIKIKLKCSI